MAAETPSKRLTASHRAVVFIHGIGEQSPCSTLIEFVGGLGAAQNNHGATAIQRLRGLWVSSHYYAALRLNNGPHAPIDFYEYYWAHHTARNRWRPVLGWLASLLLRNPAALPQVLGAYWGLLWLNIIITVSMAATVLVPPEILPSWLLAFRGQMTIALIAVITVMHLVIIPIIGDAARYLRPTPANYSVRNAIRLAAIELIEALTKDHRYSEIIIVGHSLGSVIAYDVLCLLWERQIARVRGDEAGSRAHPGVAANWKVSHLVTIGSPLTYANHLMPNAAKPWRLWRKRAMDGHQCLSSTTPFTVVAWTNLFDPVRAVIFGDPVGGPLQTLFGPDVKDFSARLSPGFFSHTRYWRPSNNENAHLAKLRQIIGIV
jgi:pimeloyl-ACP methyl ester carboxylesterase